MRSEELRRIALGEIQDSSIKEEAMVFPD